MTSGLAVGAGVTSGGAAAVGRRLGAGPSVLRVERGERRAMRWFRKGRIIQRGGSEVLEFAGSGFGSSGAEVLEFAASRRPRLPAPDGPDGSGIADSRLPVAGSRLPGSRLPTAILNVSGRPGHLTRAERYRSGRNGGASKASCRASGTWVRIPPSPPFISSKPVNTVRALLCRPCDLSP